MVPRKDPYSVFLLKLVIWEWVDLNTLFDTLPSPVKLVLLWCLVLPLRVFILFFFMTLRLLSPFILVFTIFLLIVITLLAWGMLLWWIDLSAWCLVPLWFEAALVFDELEAPDMLCRFGKCVIIPDAFVFETLEAWVDCFPTWWSIVQRLGIPKPSKFVNIVKFDNLCII